MRTRYSMAIVFGVFCAAILLNANLGRAQSGTWQTLHSNFLICYDMQFLADDTGYFAGANELAKTSDGGTTITPLAVPVDTAHMTFLSMAWPTHQSGFVSGEFDSTNQGLAPVTVLLHTTNAGASWTRLPIDSAFRMSQIAFPSSTIGYYQANQGNNGNSTPSRLAKTTDGGITWKNILYDTRHVIGLVKFRNENEGFVVRYVDDGINTNVRLFFTSDGGNSFIERDDSMQTSSDITGLYPATDGSWSVAADGVIWRTTDRGVHWKQIPNSDYAGTFTGFANLTFEATYTLVIDTLQTSTDYGASWTGTTGLSDPGFIKFFSMPSKNVAYVLVNSDSPDKRWQFEKWTNTNHLTVHTSIVNRESLDVSYLLNGDVLLHYTPDDAHALHEPIAITDINGRRAALTIFTELSGTSVIATTALSAGVYFATLGTQHVKFVIQSR